MAKFPTPFLYVGFALALSPLSSEPEMAASHAGSLARRIPLHLCPRSYLPGKIWEKGFAETQNGALSAMPRCSSTPAPTPSPANKTTETTIRSSAVAVFLLPRSARPGPDHQLAYPPPPMPPAAPWPDLNKMPGRMSYFESLQRWRAWPSSFRSNFRTWLSRRPQEQGHLSAER
jgi:hypothetical protein